MTTQQPLLRLLGRTYCHLCHDMEVALQPLLDEFGIAIEVIDVDQFPELEDTWGELVPVLLHGDSELCHYFLEEAKVRAYLAGL
ncbi:MAG: glutaredoxin family protein [Hyphomicrobium sp.]